MLLGALSLPRWPSQSGLDSGLRGSGSSVSSNGDDHSRSAKTLEQSLLTTCVGTINELHELLQRVTQFHFRHSAPCPGATPNGGAKQALTWASSALHALFYFMRCSQVKMAHKRALIANVLLLDSGFVSPSPPLHRNKVGFISIIDFYLWVKKKQKTVGTCRARTESSYPRIGVRTTLYRAAATDRMGSGGQRSFGASPFLRTG